MSVCLFMFVVFLLVLFAVVLRLVEVSLVVFVGCWLLVLHCLLFIFGVVLVSGLNSLFIAFFGGLF